MGHLTFELQMLSQNKKLNTKICIIKESLYVNLLNIDDEKI